MLTIRLQRVGKKKFPTYRLVISENHRDTQGDHLENLGNFNPHVKENGLVVKADRIKHWLKQGAQMSATVNNLLVSNNIIEGTKEKSVFLSKKRKEKLVEKNKVAEEEKAKKAEAEKAKKEQEKAEAEAKIAEEKKAQEEVKEEPSKEEGEKEKGDEVSKEEEKSEEKKEEKEEEKTEEKEVPVAEKKEETPAE